MKKIHKWVNDHTMPISKSECGKILLYLDKGFKFGWTKTYGPLSSKYWGNVACKKCIKKLNDRIRKNEEILKKEKK